MYATSTGYGLHLALFWSASSGVYARQGVMVTGTITSTNGYAFNVSDSTPLYFGGCFSSTDFGSGPFEQPYYADGAVAGYSVGTVGNLLLNGGRVAFYNAMAAFQTALGRNV